MNKLAIAGKWFCAVAFVVFGIQHFMYAKYVATLVPAFMPWHLFWAYFVGLAFIGFSASVVVNKYVFFSATMLAILMGLFILLIHVPNLIGNPQNAQSWTRALQDVAITGTALLLTGDRKLQAAGRYLFAVPLVFLAMQHFAHVGFVTAKVPDWFTGVAAWDYLIGTAMTILTLLTVINRYGAVPAVALGSLLLLFAMLYHLPLLTRNVYNGQEWTGAMLDIAIAGGAFIATALPAAYYKPYPGNLTQNNTYYQI